MADSKTQGTSQDLQEEAVDPAVVTFGSMTLGKATLFNDKAVKELYADYYIKSYYEFDQHRYMMPITSPGGFKGDKTAFVQLAAATCLWICDWTGDRRGGHPDYPRAWIESQNPNLVLLDMHYNPEMLELMADGVTLKYRLSGTYVYGFKDSEKTELHFGRPPWMQSKVNITVNALHMKDDLIIKTGGEAGGYDEP